MGATSLQVNPSSLRFTIVSLGNAKVSLAKAGEASVLAAGRLYYNIVRENISLRDHSLADLAALDHPYAKRHRTIRLHRGDTRGGYIADGTSLVHRQSGDMRASLRGRLVARGRRAAYEVDFDGSAPNADDVLLGTPRMLPRDPLWQTSIAPQTIRDMRLEIVRTLGAKLRSQAVVRFAP
jgi:hypothetical protein